MSDNVHPDFKGPQNFSGLCDLYSDFIDGCILLNYMVRSVDLQRNKVDEIDSYVLGIKGIKAQAVAREEEEVARVMFHFQCMLRSIQSALRVWIELKAGDNVRAWSNLVDAQEYCEVALVADDHTGARTLEVVLDRMQACLFPTFNLFNSPGTIETVGECSICGEPFAACDHIEGLIYHGRLCRRGDIEILEANHVALVEHPRDRRCIITSRSTDEGRMLDLMTLEETGDVELEPGVLMRGKSIVLTMTGLDFD